MSITSELRTIEDSLEDMDNKIRTINGTMQMIVMSLDAGINTEQASWVAAGVVCNTNNMLVEIEKLIHSTIKIRTNIEKLIT